jgi:hypothetical protein
MTAQAIQTVSPLGLNPIQMHLLHLFSHKMSDVELSEIKLLLVEWYDRKAQEIMDEIWEKRGLTNHAMEAILETRHRSSPRK